MTPVSKKYYSCKIYRKGEVVSQSRTTSLRRFLRNLRLIHFTDSTKKVYLKVSYGKKKDYRGKLSEFINEGMYDNSEDLLQAAVAFTNEV